MAAGRTKVIGAALVANLLIAVVKLIVGLVTRSSAMLAEAAHSVADTANQALLLLGVRLSRRPPDEQHPFGYGRETYFWAFIVALMLFSVGAAFSIYEGVHKLAGPLEPLKNPLWALAVLGVATVLELYSFFVALREFRHVQAGRTIRQTIDEARDPVIITVLFEDTAALSGLVIAAVGISLAMVTGDVRWDGIASIVVGLELGFVAFFLARESRHMLLGESVPARVQKKIQELVAAEPGVEQVLDIRTVHMGPDDAIAAIKVKFRETLCVADVERTTNEVEARLREAIPYLRRIYIEAGARTGGALTVSAEQRAALRSGVTA